MYLDGKVVDLGSQIFLRVSRSSREDKTPVAIETLENMASCRVRLRLGLAPANEQNQQQRQRETPESVERVS